MAKFHYFDYKENQKIPVELREKHNSKLEYAAIDGYIRKRCTSIIPLVSCFYCKKEMKRRGIIK